MPVVLQVVLSLSPGGAERMVIELSKRGARSYRTVVCCLDAPGAWAAELGERGIEVIPLERRPGFRPSLGRQVARLARQRRARVIHCHQYSPFVYSQIATFWNPGLRIVFTEHGRASDAPPAAKRKFVNRFLGRLPATICAVSTELRRHMVAEGFPARCVQVVPNGIEPGPPTTELDRRWAQATFGIPESSFVIGTAARLDPVKDLTTLIDAFGILRAGISRAVLVIIGDGPERPRLEERVRQAGLSHAVFFVGHRNDVRTLLPGLDLYVNCSVSEGTSITILEAMASSLPVVATRVGGTPDVVLEGETGLLVPARTAGALASAVSELASDPARATALGRAGRRRLEARFTLDRMVETYVRAYQGFPLAGC